MFSLNNDRFSDVMKNEKHKYQTDLSIIGFISYFI